MAANFSFSELIRGARVRLGYDLHTTARAAGCSESYISLIEADKRLPSEELAVRMARSLGIDPTEALLALLRSRLPAACRSVLEPAALVRDPALQFDVLRRFLGGHFDARASRVVSRVEIDWDGDAVVRQRVEGLEPARPDRPLKEVVVREPLPEGSVGEFVAARAKPTVFESPPGLHFEYSGEPVGEEFVHVFVFPEGWSAAAEGGLTFETRVEIRRAFEMDLGALLARRGPRARNHVLQWALPRFVDRLVGLLEVEVRFPEGYAARDLRPWAWLGDRPFEEAVSDLFASQVCASHEFLSDAGRALLRVVEPLPFYSYAITWRPMERGDLIDARHRR